MLFSTLFGMIFALAYFWVLFSLFLWMSLTLLGDEWSSPFNVHCVILDFAHPGGLILPTFFGVLMADLSLGIVCGTCFVSRLTFFLYMGLVI